MNLTGYILYLPITFYITVYVGNGLYRNGEVFLMSLFNNDKHLVYQYNKFLITGYYLVNLGYATISVNLWDEINTSLELVEELSGRVGWIVITLGVMHYINMLAFAIISKNHKVSINSKNQQP